MLYSEVFPQTMYCSRVVRLRGDLFKNCYKYFGPGTVRSLHGKADYDKLGVPHTATKKEIKAAYFKKAKLLHPDSSGDGEDKNEQFNELNEAYQRLTTGSVKAKKSYDSFRNEMEEMQRRQYAEDIRKYEEEEELRRKTGGLSHLLPIFFLLVIMGGFLRVIVLPLFQDPVCDNFSAGCDCKWCNRRRAAQKASGKSSDQQAEVEDVQSKIKNLK